MDEKVKTELQTFLLKVNGEREENRRQMMRANTFIANFRDSIRNVIEPAMHEFIAELDGNLGIPACEVHALPQQAVPTIRFEFQVKTSPVGLQGYNGEPLPPPSFTLRANESTMKVDIDSGGGSTSSVEPEEVTAEWVQRQLLERLKLIVANRQSELTD